MDTGSSSDAVLARCAVAYACGRAGTRSARVVASTTGVSSTTVASRAQHGRRHGTDDEHLGQQPPGVTVGRPRHGRARRAEQALVVAQLRQHEHGREKPDHREQLLDLVGRIAQRDHIDCDQERGRRNRGDGLRPAPRLDHREGQHDGKRHQRERQLHGSARCQSVGRCSGMPSSSASAVSTRIETSEVVSGIGKGAQRFGQRPEEVVPVDQHDAARADGPHRLASSSRRDNARAAHPAVRCPDRRPRRGIRRVRRATKPALPTISSRRSDGRWCTSVDHASPHL